MLNVLDEQQVYSSKQWKAAIMRSFVLTCLAGFAAAAAVNDVASIADYTAAPRTISNSEAASRNANYIFNAIRGAMRQWDSSWNHNGMSFFLAEVPEGVQFYHGTGEENSVTGMEWLAFEPEHALMFARGRLIGPPGEGEPDRPRRPPKPKFRHDYAPAGPPKGPKPPSFDGFDCYRKGKHDCHPPPPPPPDFLDHRHPDRLPHHPPFERDMGSHVNNQHILSTPKPPRGPQLPPGWHFNSTGFLHHYRTKHSLSLLLIDGMSAGKTSKGTLDSQDYILRRGLSDTPGMPFDDLQRAQALCNTSRDEWDTKVDGFIRMEGGFEVILCNFSDNLQLERAQHVEHGNRTYNDATGSGFRYYRAIADRYHGIGGDRVRIDFDSMVTAFATDMDLFINDTVLPNEVLPRLKKQNEAQLSTLRDQVKSMVLNPRKSANINWQSIADLFVQRYADPLQYLASAELSGDDFKAELEVLLRPFVSDSLKNDSITARRCVDQFLPRGQDSLAGQVVQHVSHKLCHTLARVLSNITASEALPAGGEEIYALGRDSINKLVTWLDWPVWRECRPSCAYNEVCVLPIWPLTSSVEDRKQPRCKNATTFAEERPGPGRGDKDGLNYWYVDERDA